MEKRRILWAIVFGSMLAITGCGDDASSSGGSAGSGGSGGSAGSGGSGGTGGTGGTGGSNGGGPSGSSCEAICSSTCAFEGVDPGDLDYETCVSQCEMSVPQFDDNCGPELDAFLGCLEANGCDEDTGNCISQGNAWGLCFAGVSLP